MSDWDDSVNQEIQNVVQNTPAPDNNLGNINSDNAGNIASGGAVAAQRAEEPSRQESTKDTTGTETPANTSVGEATPLEEYGSIEAVAQVLKEFGGVEQAKTAKQIWDLLNDESRPLPELIEQAYKIAPTAIENIVAYIADEAQKEFKTKFYEQTFGRTLSQEEIEKVRDYLAYGENENEKFVDEFGNPLPESIVGPLKMERQRNRELMQQLKQLEAKVNERIQSIETPLRQEELNKFTREILNPMIERADSLGLLKPQPGETSELRTQRIELADLLESFTMRFLQQDAEAQKMISQVEKKIGDKSPAAQAYIKDASVRLQKRVARAADKAATYVSKLMGAQLNPPAQQRQQTFAMSGNSNSIGRQTVTTQSPFITSPVKGGADEWEIDTNTILAGIRRR